MRGQDKNTTVCTDGLRQDVSYLKIEKINENQIRCILTRADLEERQIELSELAYGSENARRLFHELIATAAAEVDFDVDDDPVMVEAIPLNRDSIMLVVTRVEDPDELDARFSSFSPDPDVDWTDEEPSGDVLEGAENLMPALSSAGCVQTAAVNGQSRINEFHCFRFQNLDQAVAGAKAVQGTDQLQSTLYKDDRDGSFILCIYMSDQPDTFIRTCNTLSEYGTIMRSRGSSLAYMEEHCEKFISSCALNKLAKI